MLPHLYVLLETQRPIKFNDIMIYQMSLSDVLDYGIEEYNMLLLPFLLDIDDFDIKISDKDKIKDINIFDILLLDEKSFSMLLNSLSFFCKTDEISYDEKKQIFYIGKGYIDRNNFEEFSQILLKFNSKQKIKREKPPENLSPKQKEIWDKLHEGRERANAKLQIQLEDLINICEFGGEYYIPISEIEKWSFWNITRCYQSILGKSNFNESFDVYCITGEDKLIKNRHWTDLIKVNNKEEIQ